MEDATKNKISTFCHVAPSHVFSVHDVINIYHVPLILVQQGIHTILKNKLNLINMVPSPNLVQWEAMARSVDDHSRAVRIAIVGKYTQNADSYLSVNKSLVHAGIHLEVHVETCWVEASDLEEDTKTADAAKYNDAWAAVRCIATIPSVCNTARPLHVYVL